MRLHALLLVYLTYTTSTACGAGMGDYIDPYEGTEAKAKTLPTDQQPNKNTTHTEVFNSETCMLSGLAHCPVLHPESFAQCSAELTALAKGKISQCEYDTCYVNRVAVESMVYHASCVNLACPVYAVDINRLRECATELRDENLDCMRSTDCSPSACPLITGYVERQQFMNDCLND